MRLQYNTLTPIVRFHLKYTIDPDSGCHEWNGLRKKGYGLFSIKEVRFLAHRWIYAYHHGEIPEGLCICHRCDNPSCVNIEHLFMGTVKDNNRDMRSKGRDRGASSFIGTDNRSAKLNPDKVREIRAKNYNGQSLRSLYKEYKVSPRNIRRICERTIWRHVE